VHFVRVQKRITAKNDDGNKDFEAEIKAEILSN
jgi:hypothetical protein